MEEGSCQEERWSHTDEQKKAIYTQKQAEEVLHLVGHLVY